MRMIGKPEWFTYRAMGWGMDVRTKLGSTLYLRWKR